MSHLPVTPGQFAIVRTLKRIDLYEKRIKRAQHKRTSMTK